MWEQPFNCGQHIAHNEMLDECVRLNADYHVRVDDDCWVSNKKWKTRMLQAFLDFKRGGYTRVSASMNIKGLMNPPESDTVILFPRSTGGSTKTEKVSILGGIFRMTPMVIMRYFRWDERLPMGMGEAKQFANFCEGNKIDLLRVMSLSATHGESTLRQEMDREWAHSHDMLQYVPFGL